MTRIFLSYARGDDEPFVRRLYDDLTGAGFTVWFDRVSMPSRALTFLQEIRDAIAASDRLLLVIGPKAAASDYVAAEWRCALELCTAVTPVLRLGDYNLMPSELSVHHSPDARPERPYADALAELLRILAEPVPPLANLHGVPSLPAARNVLDQAIRARFLANQREHKSAQDLSIQPLETLRESLHRSSRQQADAIGTKLRAINCGMWPATMREHGIRLEVVKLPTAKHGFVLLPRRWVVERSFAWMACFRHLTRDYECLSETLAGLHFLASAILMAKRFMDSMVQNA